MCVCARARSIILIEIWKTYFLCEKLRYGGIDILHFSTSYILCECEFCTCVCMYVCRRNATVHQVEVAIANCQVKNKNQVQHFIKSSVEQWFQC